MARKATDQVTMKVAAPPACGAPDRKGSGSKAQRSPLLAPIGGNTAHQVLELECLRLPAVEDRFDDIGREQGQAQDAADIGVVDLLGRGQLFDAAVGAILNQPLPAVGTAQGPDQNSVGSGGQWGPVLLAVRSDDQLAAAVALEMQWDADDECQPFEPSRAGVDPVVGHQAASFFLIS